MAKVIHPGPAAYSDLVVLPDKTIGCLCERGDESPYERITFAAFPCLEIAARNFAKAGNIPGG